MQDPDEVDPHADLVGFRFTSNYRDRFDFLTEVVEVAPWNAAYVNVNVTNLKTGVVTKSSRRVEHVRARKGE